MANCAAIKNNGERCKAGANEGSDWCYNHDPAREEERKANARKGGKRGGRGRPLSEIHAAKDEIRRVIDAVEVGDIEPKVGGTMFQGWNLILRTLETERNIKETEELEERIASLEKAKPAKPRTFRRG